ncbi:hypothetical protein JD844_009061, partial [Phrynosoma platyrhinos]
HFLCYTCKEYVEDLGKIPKKFLEDANVRLIVIGQSTHDHIKRVPCLIRVQSPHVKSNFLSGSIKSMWRAMVSPAFDFQGDPAQQGGTLILGPGNEIHFVHLDKNRLDHVPINTVLQLAGVQTVDFTQRSQIIDI